MMLSGVLNILIIGMMIYNILGICREEESTSHSTTKNRYIFRGVFNCIISFVCVFSLCFLSDSIPKYLYIILLIGVCTIMVFGMIYIFKAVMGSDLR